MELKKKLFSFSLLLVLLAAIVPLESFHFHEEEHIICGDFSIHIEEKKFECALGNFVLPVFDQENNSLTFESSAHTFQFTETDFPLISKNLYFLADYRGPPATV